MESLWYAPRAGECQDQDEDVSRQENLNLDISKGFEIDLEDDSDEGTADSNGLNIPELEITVNGGKNEDEEVEDEDDDEVDDEDDIQMDEEDCDDELEPQFKRKKTK